MQNKQLNEGLRSKDLENMVHPMFEVDSYQSKMGEDRDVCVVSFQVKDRAPAKDLMEFIEKGYNFVLDSDVSSGENEHGEYSVFVELSRSPKLAEQIEDLLYGVKKLTGVEDWKFKYYKKSGLHEATREALANAIPPTAKDYDGLLVKHQTESVKKFFSKTLMDDLTLDGDVITIHKPFDKRVKLRMVKEGESQSILEGSEDKISVDEQSASEIFWLTKVLGDYGINKFGENFLFTNGSKSMLIQRVE